MKIEIPDGVTAASVMIHAKTRAHVKDVQAQFPDAEWEHELVESRIYRRGYFPTVRASVDGVDITIFPNVCNRQKQSFDDRLRSQGYTDQQINAGHDRLAQALEGEDA